MDITVQDVPERQQYEAGLDGAVAGIVAYEREGAGVVRLTHTVVDPAFEGRGVGGALVRAVLDDVRAQHGTVVPQCPFVASWLERHPDYADLVAA